MWARSTPAAEISVNTNEITLFFSLSILPCHFKMMTNTNIASWLLLLFNPPSNLPLICGHPCLSPRPLYVHGQLKSIQYSSVPLNGHLVNTGHLFSLFLFLLLPLPISVCFTSHFYSRHHSLHQFHVNILQ